MEFNEQLVMKELDKLVNETMDLSNASQLERRVVLEQVIQHAMLIGRGYPSKVHRMVYEILHKYYCMMEGLEK